MCGTARSQENTPDVDFNSYRRLSVHKFLEVAIDMWNPYETVCAELLPNAVITADRFHVMQAVNAGAQDG